MCLHAGRELEAQVLSIVTGDPADSFSDILDHMSNSTNCEPPRQLSEGDIDIIKLAQLNSSHLPFLKHLLERNVITANGRLSLNYTMRRLEDEAGKHTIACTCAQHVSVVKRVHV